MKRPRSRNGRHRHSLPGQKAFRYATHEGIRQLPPPSCTTRRLSVRFFLLTLFGHSLYPSIISQSPPFVKRIASFCPAFAQIYRPPEFAAAVNDKPALFWYNKDGTLVPGKYHGGALPCGSDPSFFCLPSLEGGDAYVCNLGAAFSVCRLCFIPSRLRRQSS